MPTLVHANSRDCLALGSAVLACVRQGAKARRLKVCTDSPMQSSRSRVGQGSHGIFKGPESSVPESAGDNGRTLQGSTPHTAWPGVAPAIFNTVPRLGSTDFVTAAWAVPRGPRHRSLARAKSRTRLPVGHTLQGFATHCRAWRHRPLFGAAPRLSSTDSAAAVWAVPRGLRQMTSRSCRISYSPHVGTVFQDMSCAVPASP